MDAELKKKWIEKLRSGEYKQGQEILKHSNGRYCCLGVLCEAMGYTDWKSDDYGDLSIQLPEWDTPVTGNIPRPLQEKIGMTHEQNGELICMNDSKAYNFEQIADYIEREM
jgi:hypothetical protein